MGEMNDLMWMLVELNTGTHIGFKITDFLNLLFSNSHDHLSLLFFSPCATNITYCILCEAFHLQIDCFHSSLIHALNADVFLNLDSFPIKLVAKVFQKIVRIFKYQNLTR